MPIKQVEEFDAQWAEGNGPTSAPLLNQKKTSWWDIHTQQIDNLLTPGNPVPREMPMGQIGRHTNKEKGSNNKGCSNRTLYSTQGITRPHSLRVFSILGPNGAVEWKCTTVCTICFLTLHLGVSPQNTYGHDCLQDCQKNWGGVRV